jgi:hypothetical protein
VSTDAARWSGIDGQPEPRARDERLDFVRFCYRRRRVAWPELYDEMAAVAARGDYEGLGYPELAERGISFTLSELPRLVALSEQVMAEEGDGQATPLGMAAAPA